MLKFSTIKQLFCLSYEYELEYLFLFAINIFKIEWTRTLNENVIFFNE